MSVENIPSTMRAVRLTAFNSPYSLVSDAPVPKDLHPQDLLVKVAVASYCHTDSMVSAGTFGTPLPCTASHEGAGTVVAVGSSVEPTSFKTGDRVMVGLPLHPCGKCDDCTGPEVYRHYCRHIDGHVGVQVDGCFAEYVRADARQSVKLPDQVSFLTAAPLACAGRTIWRGLLTAGLEKGQSLAIIGSGGALGHLGIQFAKGRGLKVIGVDARDPGLDLSQATGADVVIDARKGKDTVVEEVQNATAGKGADATIVLSDAPEAMGMGCAATRMHGTVVEIAQPDDVVIPFWELVFRDLRVRGSLLASPEESAQMLRFVAERGIHLESNVFQGLESIEQLLSLVHGGNMKGKAILVIDQEQVA